MQQVHTCPECKGLCQKLYVAVRPKSSEWYCERCHRSYPIEGVTAPDPLHA